MGLSRNKVAVPEGAAGSPPFYGVFWRGLRRFFCLILFSFLFVWGLLTRKVLLGRGMSMFLGSRAVSFGEGFLRLRRGARFLRFLFFAAGLRFDNWTVDASNAGFVPALL